MIHFDYDIIISCSAGKACVQNTAADKVQRSAKLLMNGLRSKTKRSSLGLQIQGSQTDEASVGCARTSPVHGGPTSQTTGLEDSASNAWCQTPQDTPRGPEPTPRGVGEKFDQRCSLVRTCSGITHRCWIRLGYGEFGSDFDTMRSLWRPLLSP